MQFITNNRTNQGQINKKMIEYFTLFIKLLQQNIIYNNYNFVYITVLSKLIYAFFILNLLKYVRKR